MRIFFMKPEDLITTAQLAHIYLDEAGIKRVFPAFEEMINFFNTMETADADIQFQTIEARDILQAPKKINLVHLEADTLKTPNDDSLIENMLNNAGERNDRFIVVPNVL